ncbi:GNAT family N-acetyltransferase [Streptomyces sp. MK7]|uniref:GNAT family N-acetyltransferase n=1 Tax=Streptomyces sp. MK7 TaxID=3067635 RepID=UPI00292FAC29|nr:GNAT family N-acetyltransferase [Streptomyces sp. MK7]
MGTKAVGAARLRPLEEPTRAVEAGVWIGCSHRGAGVGGSVLRHLLDQARADGFAMVFVSTGPNNKAVHRLIEGLGVDLVHNDDAVTAWVNLAEAQSS